MKQNGKGDDGTIARLFNLSTVSFIKSFSHLKYQSSKYHSLKGSFKESIINLIIIQRKFHSLKVSFTENIIH